jgi:hypothetical protein
VAGNTYGTHFKFGMMFQNEVKETLKMGDLNASTPFDSYQFEIF